MSRWLSLFERFIGFLINQVQLFPFALRETLREGAVIIVA